MFRQTRSRTKHDFEFKTPSTEIHSHSSQKPQTDDIKKLSEQFNKHYDDSSDEDEIEHKINEYNIEKIWEKLLCTQLVSEKKDSLNNDELLSFVAHAAGIKLFYSSNVNKIYYPLKKTKLKNSSSNAFSQLQLLIKTAFTDSINTAFDSLEKFLKKTEEKGNTINQFTSGKDKFVAEFQTGIEKLMTPYLGSFIKWVKLIKFTKSPIKPVAIDELEIEVLEYLKSILFKHFSLSKSSFNRESVKKQLREHSYEKLEILMKKLLFKKLVHAIGKQKAIKKLENYPEDKNLTLFMINILNDAPSRGYVESMILKELELPINQIEFKKAYTEDLIERKNSKNSKIQLSNQEQSLLNQYLSINQESVEDELSQNFMQNLKFNLENAVNSLHRPTLEEGYQFNSTNPYAFHANLRLANRSQTREIANLQSSIFRSKRSARFWHLAPFTLPVSNVFEVQEILKSSFGRRDMVFHLGNYALVYEDIQLIKKYFSSMGQKISDKHIANYIRDIFKGHPPTFQIPATDEIEILHKLQAITYLLLGCEATRNPAMHIINQMLLDLIIRNDEWTFEEALVGEKNQKPVSDKCVKRMPMAPEGAVAVSRHLISDYQNYMPYPYIYQGTQDNDGKFHKSELIKLEARVVRDWIQLSESKISSKTPLSVWLLDLIEKHFETWMGKPSVINQELKSTKNSSL